MTSEHKRLDDLTKANVGKGLLGMPRAVERQLMDFAKWRLPQDEAVELLGERQLEEWRHRLINLVRWIWVRRALGEPPRMGDGVQIAAGIASYAPGEDPPAILDARMTMFRQFYVDHQNDIAVNDIAVNYLIVALLAATLLGAPDGMPLRRWIANEAPDAWSSPPTQRDGYNYEMWLGPRSNPFHVARTTLAMEGETLGTPWNSI